MLLRLKVWKHWNKKCVNSKMYKLLVLLGVIQSPSFYNSYIYAKHCLDHADSLSDILEARMIAIKGIKGE